MGDMNLGFSSLVYLIDTCMVEKSERKSIPSFSKRKLFSANNLIAHSRDGIIYE
jgi:hypothetical protein